jgi:hypothetical protein
MGFLRPRRRAETAVDDYERLVKRLVILEADVDRLSREWLDAKSQIKRSYQRLEKAIERSEAPAQPDPQAAPENERGIDKQLRLARAARGG